MCLRSVLHRCAKFWRCTFRFDGTCRCVCRLAARTKQLKRSADSGGDSNDLWMFDPAARAWTDLTATFQGTPPSVRDSHGFASAGGMLYVQGGHDAFSGADLAFHCDRGPNFQHAGPNFSFVSDLSRSQFHIVDAVTQAMYWAIFLRSTLRTACGRRWQAHPLQLQCLVMVSRRPGADSTRTAALTDQVNVIFCPWLGLARSCTDLRWTS